MAYIGVDRGIEDHWIYQDAEYFKVWFEILLRARYSKETEKKLVEGKLVEINYGQFMFGRISWSDRLKISEQRLRTLFKKLVDDGMIELVQKFPKFSLYSVKNYAKYNQQSNQQKTESGQGFEGDVNQQDNDTPTSSQPAANQQPTTQEESKQGKPSKQGNKEIKNAQEFAMFWEVYPKKVAKQPAIKAWDKLMRDKELKMDPVTLVTCAMNYGAYIAANETELRFILHPASFLNGKRYEEYTTPFLIHSKGGQQNAKHGTGHDGRTSAELDALSL